MNKDEFMLKMQDIMFQFACDYGENAVNYDKKEADKVYELAFKVLRTISFNERLTLQNLIGG